MLADLGALLAAARSVQQQAYAPFSGYTVGAAVLDEHGGLHLGCNVENASYPEGICAEANAIGSMVAAGGRRIVAIAVTGSASADANPSFAEHGGACTPCGGCRQRILEFADDDTQILMLDAVGEPLSCRMADLLPQSFQLNSSND